MKRITLLSPFLFAALALVGCAAPSNATRREAKAMSGPAVRSVELPTAAGTGEPREVRVLVDDPALKLVTITLRGGTRLPEHDAPAPVVIQSLSGGGTVLAGGERLRLDPAHAVVLSPNVPHAVEPDAGADLVLLVQHLRGAVK